MASMYPIQRSQVNLRDENYVQNEKSWGPILDRFEAALQDVCSEGSDASLSRHQSRGQLLPRDRISLLLDQDSPFLELCPFAGYGNTNSTPCGNLISGIGLVRTVIKVNRMLEIASENDLPLISLVQSAGVFLPQQFRVFHKGGQLFHDLAVRTLNGQPSCAVVFGSSTAGGAYHPALSDYTIFVQNQAQAFLGGPPLVKMATGEVIGAEELGGADIHARQTGLADQLALDEFDAIRKAREWVASLQPRSRRVHQLAPSQPLPPRYPIEDVLRLVNPDVRKAFDMKEVVLRLVDDSRLSIFKPKYGANILTTWAHIMGFPVGIVANQVSIINPNEAAKAAQFIRLCNQEAVPIIFLHNVTGFMVGAKAEHAGIIKMGAQLVSAVSCSQVPHISVILGASYGAGNYAMCGRAYKPRFIFTWPIGKCSVMGPDQLAGVMEQIQTAKTGAAPTLLGAGVAKLGSPSTELVSAPLPPPSKKIYRTSRELRNEPQPLSVSPCSGWGGETTIRSVYFFLDGVTLDACPQRPPLFVAPLPINPSTGLPLIRKVLIANRGEIASRIIQTCRKLSVQTALIYVEEDQNLRHITEADNALSINPFLNIQLLIQTAVDLGADAIHPGYGYLSENAEFATAVANAGLVFIGPSPNAIMSKKYLEEHAPDVPLIPGFSGSSVQVEHLQEAAEKIGYPIMLKASAGGGGKGMRVLERVQSEASRSFGSSDCILEKYIESSKHVEVQIIGDKHGNVVSFFERDCSLIEESPCTMLSDQVRREMGQVAVRIAKLIGYSNAGTVEFVFDVDTSQFFFLEVNARLQVEHPISEEVTGVDLVALQLFAASGGDLTTLQHVNPPRQFGHAIECRLCAEDPQRDFLPDHGPVHLWAPGEGSLGPGRDIRYETAMHFDSMIAKEMAIQKMKDVLANTACIGVKTNQLFLQFCLDHEEFRGGRYQTSFIPRNRDQLLTPPVQYEQELGMLPSFFLRAMQHRLRDSFRYRRPFRNVQPHFRNQHHDPVNVHCDVITHDWFSPSEIDRKSPKLPTLYVWQPGSSRSEGSHGKAQIISLAQLRASISKDGDSDSGAAAKVIASEYNAVSNILRHESSRPLDIEFRSFTPLKSSGSSAIIDASIGGKRVRAYCVAPRDQTPFPNESQIVFCHFPHLGTFIQFRKDSLLTWCENQRASVQAKEEQGQEDIIAPMPCKILSIKKKNGEHVKEGELLMVIESMKMEVSIKANKTGRFETSWKDGDAAEEGRVLCRTV
ncbi:carboxyl transferase domain-containing protein [Mariannaea sp. PMI_226]|nr:carboxyl transferase domain-containing protein [Mariannaea sp. PMI_226]